MTPDEVQDLDEEEVQQPNPYVIKKDTTELDEEFDKPDLLSEEAKAEKLAETSTQKPKKPKNEQGISKYNI